MDFTPDQLADAERDVMALIRARLSDDLEGMEAILDSAGEREQRLALMIMAGAVAGQMIKLTAALLLIEDEDKQAWVQNTDTEDMLADNPRLRELVERNAENIQADLIRGDEDRPDPEGD
jgi:hypothetical protein